jgi:hypothetical protein
MIFAALSGRALAARAVTGADWRLDQAGMQAGAVLWFMGHC